MPTPKNMSHLKAGIFVPLLIVASLVPGTEADIGLAFNISVDKWINQWVNCNLKNYPSKEFIC